MADENCRAGHRIRPAQTLLCKYQKSKADAAAKPSALVAKGVPTAARMDRPRKSRSDTGAQRGPNRITKEKQVRAKVESSERRPMTPTEGSSPKGFDRFAALCQYSPIWRVCVVEQ